MEADSMKTEAEPESQVDYIRKLIEKKDYDSLKKQLLKGYIPTNEDIEFALSIDLEIANFLVESSIM